MTFWTQPERITAASLNNNCAALHGAGGRIALICTQSRGLNHVLSKHGYICPLFYGLETGQSVMKAWERQCYFHFTKSCIVSSFWIAFFLVLQTHPVWFLQIGFLQNLLNPTVTNQGWVQALSLSPKEKWKPDNSCAVFDEDVLSCSETFLFF